MKLYLVTETDWSNCESASHVFTTLFELQNYMRDVKRELTALDHDDIEGTALWVHSATFDATYREIDLPIGEPS